MGVIANPFLIRELIQKYSDSIIQDEISRGKLGLLISNLNNALKQFVVEGEEKKNLTDKNRHLVLGFVFGDGNYRISRLSSKQLTSAQVHALERWIYGKHPNSDNQGKWMPRPDFAAEARWVLNVAVTIEQITNNPGNEKLPMALANVIEAIRPYVLYSIENLDSIPGEDSNFVSDSLNLPGAVPVEKSFHPDRKEYNPNKSPDVIPVQPKVIDFDDDMSSL